MPLQVLCAAAAARVPASASLCGIGGGGVSGCSSQTKGGYWAAGGRRSVTISGGCGGELLLRGPRDAPTGSRDAVTQQHAGLFSARGLTEAYRKRWIVQSSNSEQGEEILEENNSPSSDEDNGPPVLTIIAGLLVLFVVFWALGSVVSWIVGLLFKS